MNGLTSFIDADKLRAHLIQKMNQDIMAAAEPIIQEALRKAERAMRERLGAMIIGQLETSFDVCRDGRVIQISVHQKKDGAG